MIVYSASFGGVDSDSSNPKTGRRSVMFSDTKSNWGESILMSSQDPRRATKAVKMNPSVWFDDDTVFIDANICTDNLDPIIDDFMKSGCDIGLSRHPLLDCVYDELNVMRRISDPSKRKYDINAMTKQLAAYDLPAHAGLWQGGMVLRRNNPRGRAFSRAWWDELLMWGHWRDQLSLAFVVNQGFDVYDLPPIQTDPHTFAAEMQSKYDSLGNDFHWKWIEEGNFAHINSAMNVLSHMPETNNLVVDFGCGDGVVSSLLANSGRRVLGVEVLEGPLGVATKKVPSATFVSSLSEPPHMPYDLLMLDVMEHVETRCLDELRTLIQNAETVTISVPHCGMDPWAVRDVSLEWLVKTFRVNFKPLSANKDGIIYGVNHD